MKLKFNHKANSFEEAIGIKAKDVSKRLALVKKALLSLGDKSMLRSEHVEIIRKMFDKKTLDEAALLAYMIFIESITDEKIEGFMPLSRFF